MSANDLRGGNDEPEHEMMAPERKPPQPLDHAFTATLLPEAGGVAWTCVIVPGSIELLGTRRAAKVTATVDGAPLSSSLMPIGDGRHMLPVKAPILKAIGKAVGDEVDIRLNERLS